MKMNRRQFLNHTCATGTTALTSVTALGSLGMMRSASAQTAGDYRALVCILLAGGNDAYNMLVPTDGPQYAAYSTIRSDLALPRDTLLALNFPETSDRTFGLHPGMGRLAGLINSGDAAMVANVGTLLEPFDAQAVENGTATLPVGLFSHADQIAQWQTAMPDQRSAVGWGGRMADLMQGINLANGVSMNVSLSGSNTFQSGRTTNEFSITSEGDGALSINGYDEDSFFGDFRRRTTDSLLSPTRTQILRSEYRRRFRDAIDANTTFATAMQDAAQLQTTFSANGLSQALRQVARVISARDQLGASRQTFFVTVGGWDHHDEVIQNQARMLPMVSNALAEFRDALVELAAFDAVTTFTISDFARTLTSNGRGSDHGWGGHHVVMGGDVSGGRLFGDYPLLADNSVLDVGRGIYAPTLATDEYFADLALWFGVSDSDLALVLPNVRRFVASGSGSPLGLFGG
ncbi:MAG: DUF1501 domain-containing protein [Pseudomonadota bacterium]